MTTVQIGHRRVGHGEPCLIIAEAGVNYNGDLKLAKKPIDPAREAGADAVRLQTFETQHVVTKRAAKAWYQEEVA